MTQRIVIAANRLPVRQVDGQWQRSPGGLVSALTPLLQAANGVWVGWSGEADQELAPFEHDGIEHVAIPLTSDEESEHYLGFSNSTIWPLYHHAVRTPEYHRTWWHSYRMVNERFADAIAEVAGSDDLIWIHDYQLQLLPKLVRERIPDASIRFFLHIPFPPVELYARLPWRSEVIEGLLASDLIAFQTQRSATNFINAATAFGDAKAWDTNVVHANGRTKVVSTPISIDVQDFTRIADSPFTVSAVDRVRSDLGHPRFMFLGADRLDYTKGIDVRLKAFETLLSSHPELAGDTKFVQIGVPSRETIGDYAEMRQEIEKIAGRINSTHGSVQDMPVHYAYESLSRDDLVAYYRAADVMVVTPLVDGMNLVAKEFIAARTDVDGVLILSEFAGAARELEDAVVVNPYDIDGMADAMFEAIEMDALERRERMRRMREQVVRHDVHAWAREALRGDAQLTTV
jgi:trehalose 6-phosphate synthase